MLSIGDPAPDFQLPTQNGELRSLADFAGRPWVLYFYPKDLTSGCTQQACSFRDHLAALEARGVAVVGASPDSVASHAKFAEKHQLSFPLLADTERQLAEACGVWGEKKLYGRTYMGILRTTFLFGADGRVLHVWAKPKTKVHAEEVLAVLEQNR